MGSKSKIDWTDKTWNVTSGCTKVSSGCKHCYAETMHGRLRAMGQSKYQHDFGEVRCHPEFLERPMRWTKPWLVFVDSMSDLFHPDVPFEFIAAVFGVMAACPQHTFQILTKRPEIMRAWFEWIGTKGPLWDDPLLGASWYETLKQKAGGEPEVWDEADACVQFAQSHGASAVFNIDDDAAAHGGRIGPGWPLPNVWLGTSVEDASTTHRIADLALTPAAVRFVSYEPALEKIDPFDVDGPAAVRMSEINPKVVTFPGEAIDWFIAGCESGPKARQADNDWFRWMRDRCGELEMPFFLKQMMVDGQLVKMPELDGKVWDQMPRRQP